MGLVAGLYHTPLVVYSPPPVREETAAAVSTKSLLVVRDGVAASAPGWIWPGSWYPSTGAAPENEVPEGGPNGDRSAEAQATVVENGLPLQFGAGDSNAAEQLGRLGTWCNQPWVRSLVEGLVRKGGKLKRVAQAKLPPESRSLARPALVGLPRMRRLILRP